MLTTIDKYNIELTDEDINYAKQVREKWEVTAWKELSLDDKKILLKYYGYHVSDDIVYGCKIVSKNYGSMFDAIIYDKLGEYIDETAREEIENYECHGPGLWALSFNEVETSYKLNNKRGGCRVIIVSYDINDVIMVGTSHLKAYKYKVVDLAPKFTFIQY